MRGSVDPLGAKEELMGKDKGPFGVYDESFDLDRDGELNAVEFDDY